MVSKRERLEKVIHGEKADRVPVSIWRYFPGDDQRAADLANAVVNYQTIYDWDYVIIPSPHDFMLTGYGGISEWDGNIQGQRRIIRSPIRRSLDWTELRVSDPDRGSLAKQLECVRLLGGIYDGQGVPYLPIVYSPLMQAAHLAGEAQLIQHLRTHPDRIQTGLNTLTETTIRYVEALRKFPIAGIIYVVEHADYQKLTPQEYEQFGVPYDYKVLEMRADNWWMNVLQLQGKAPIMAIFNDYPVQIINWQDQSSHISIAKARDLFPGALQGGLHPTEHLLMGTPADIRTTARKAMQESLSSRFILGSMMVAGITPMSNLSAARDIV